MAGVTRDTGTTSAWNVGVVPMASALVRYRLASARSPFSTMATDTGSLGDTTKWNVLSAGSGSVPASHAAADVRLGHGERARRSPTPTRAAPIVAVFVSISWPSTDRTTGMSVAGCVAPVA